MSPIIPLKILMIGNSFSICVLNYAPEAARRLDRPVDIASLYIGGCSLARHCENIRQADEPGFAPYRVTWNYASLGGKGRPAFVDDLPPADDGKPWHCKGNIPSLLAADAWDIVTIQQASHESWKPESFHPYADELIETIRKYAPQARIVIQETWSYCNGDGRIRDGKTGGPGSWGFGQEEMFDRLSANYRDLAAQYGFQVIPTGTAIQLFRERLPVREISDDVVGDMKPNAEGQLSGDSIHLNKDGEYLQACVWLAALTGADVERLDWAPEGKMRHPENAQLLRECAAEAVRRRKAEMADGQRP